MRSFRVGVLAVLVMVGCGAPAGVVRVHFTLHPPATLNFAGLTPPPLDALEVSRASGTFEATPASNLVVAHFAGLPLPPTSPHMFYRLWLSDGSADAGGGWVHAADIGSNPLGVALAQVAQVNVALPFEKIRAAMLTLDGHGAVGPSTLVVLTGAAGTDAVAASGSADAGVVGHVH